LCETAEIVNLSEEEPSIEYLINREFIQPGITYSIFFPGYELNDRNTLWFKVNGNSRPLTISTCGSTADTFIFVFDSGCSPLSNLNVKTRNDDSCGTQSLIDLCPGKGRQYIVAVDSRSPPSETFTISFTEEEGKLCSEPQRSQYMEIFYWDLPFERTGSTVSAFNDATLPLCNTNTVSFNSDQYLIRGTGTILQVSTCPSCFDTVITIAYGTSRSTPFCLHSTTMLPSVNDAQ